MIISEFFISIFVFLYLSAKAIVSKSCGFTHFNLAFFYTVFKVVILR